MHTAMCSAAEWLGRARSPDCGTPAYAGYFAFGYGGYGYAATTKVSRSCLYRLESRSSNGLRSGAFRRANRSDGKK